MTNKCIVFSFYYATRAVSGMVWVLSQALGTVAFLSDVNATFFYFFKITFGV